MLGEFRESKISGNKCLIELVMLLFNNFNLFLMKNGTEKLISTAVINTLINDDVIRIGLKHTITKPIKI